MEYDPVTIGRRMHIEVNEVCTIAESFADSRQRVFDIGSLRRIDEACGAALIGDTGVCVVLVDSSVCQPHRTLRERMAEQRRVANPNGDAKPNQAKPQDTTAHFPLQILSEGILI
jgi:hypothetical protein